MSFIPSFPPRFNISNTSSRLSSRATDVRVVLLRYVLDDFEVLLVSLWCDMRDNDCRSSLWDCIGPKSLAENDVFSAIDDELAKNTN